MKIQAADPIGGVFRSSEPAVLLHPHLHEARKFRDRQGRESGEPKYDCNFMLKGDSTDLKAIKALLGMVAKVAWPGRAMKELAFPLVSGTKKADDRAEASSAKGRASDGEFQRGMVNLVARGKFEPKLGVIRNRKIIDLEGPARAASKAEFFFGAEVLFEVKFVAYEGVGANPDGICAYLNAVVATGKGTRLSGGQSVAETFSGYAGTLSDESVTTGQGPIADDEIPFDFGGIQ
jgi:hypothetical protein